MIYDVIIIGSGPAGLAAAIYAQRARLSAVVLEKEYVSGGQVLNTYEVDNYPGLPGIGGYELGMKLREHAEKLGAQFINIEAKHIALEDQGKIKAVYTEQEEFRARTIVLAMGARYRHLEVPGEQELTGMGVSYCATCDGAFFKGKDTIVVGGGVPDMAHFPREVFEREVNACTGRDVMTYGFDYVYSQKHAGKGVIGAALFARMQMESA